MFEADPTFHFLAATEGKPVLCVAAKARRDAIKAAGGAEYDALLAYERAARARYRKKNPEAWRNHKRRGGRFQSVLCAGARSRGRKRGLEATITPADLDWPTHCPVLGLKLDYPTHGGMRTDQSSRANYPSLDRYDPNKGYVPGNVFVISFRANTLKNNATYEEILKVAKYMSRRPHER